MKNVFCLFRSVYEGFCEKVGNLIKVNFRREVIDFIEDLLSISNVFLENRCYKFKLIGSFCEGFRLKIDIDMFGWCLSDKVVFNFFYICFYCNMKYEIVILMECDDLFFGFIRLKFIVLGYVFYEIFCVEINDELYIFNYLFIKNMVKILEFIDFKRIFYYGFFIVMVFVLLKIDIDFCFKLDYWLDIVKLLI